MDDDFENSLKDITAVITGSRESINLFWRSIFHFARENISTFRTRPPFLNDFCLFLLEALKYYGCYDHNTIIKVFNIYQRCMIWFDVSNSSIYDVTYVIKPVLIDSSDNSEETMSLSAKYDLRIIFEIPDVELTKMLLKEGMLRPFKINTTEYHDLKPRLGQMFDIFMPMAVHTMLELHRRDRIIRVPGMINFAIIDECVKECLTSNYVKRTFRRKCMIAYVVKTVMMKYWNFSSWEKALAENLLCFYRATPDPFISRNEVKDFLHRYYKPEYWKEDAFETFCDIYDNLFHPDLPSHYRPRSLKHLCRCTVREILVQKKVVLSDVESALPEITFLKDFLLGGPENEFY